MSVPQVTVSVAPSLVDDADAASAAITRELAELFAELGVDGQPQARVTTAAGGRPIEITVDEVACRFPPALVAEAAAYVDGTPQIAPNPHTALVIGDEGRTVEVIATVTRAVLVDRPELLTAEAARATETLDVEIDPTYLNRISALEHDAQPFRTAREGLLVELGLTLPAFHFRPDSSLRPGGFAFRINGARTLPRIGLSPDLLLVTVDPGELPLSDVEAQPTVNPATGAPAWLVSADHKDTLGFWGIPTWDATEYVVLCLAAAVRSRVHSLVTPAQVESQLDRLASAFPFLVEQAHAELPADEVAPVLRDLLLDGVSVRDLRRILELVLRYETDDRADREVGRIAFVREGFADAIANTFASGTSTVPVYVLEPEIETALAANGDAGLADRFAAALGAELAELPASVSPPSLLTRDDLRPRLRELVRHEFPRVRVLGYADLPDDYNVQPVARITLDGDRA